MSPLRARMIEDMTLAGLALGTQKIYTRAVYKLAAHYRRSPDQLSEEEVRSYLLGLRQRGVARGTFQTRPVRPAFSLPPYARPSATQGRPAAGPPRPADPADRARRRAANPVDRAADLSVLSSRPADLHPQAHAAASDGTMIWSTHLRYHRLVPLPRALTCHREPLSQTQPTARSLPQMPPPTISKAPLSTVMPRSCPSGPAGQAEIITPATRPS
jgi:Phage integrase, N-terminal SAM-like domain